MKNKTFSNLQSRPLRGSLILGTHIDLRDTSGGKIVFVSVGNFRLVLMSRKAGLNISFLTKETLKYDCVRPSRDSITTSKKF